MTTSRTCSPTELTNPVSDLGGVSQQAAGALRSAFRIRTIRDLAESPHFSLAVHAHSAVADNNQSRFRPPAKLVDRAWSESGASEIVPRYSQCSEESARSSVRRSRGPLGCAPLATRDVEAVPTGSRNALRSDIWRNIIVERTRIPAWSTDTDATQGRPSRRIRATPPSGDDQEFVVTNRIPPRCGNLGEDRTRRADRVDTNRKRRSGYPRNRPLRRSDSGSRSGTAIRGSSPSGSAPSTSDREDDAGPESTPPQQPRVHAGD